MKQKATIYDFRRMCQAFWNNCKNCPMSDEKCSLSIMSDIEVDKANEIILNWCKENPVKTRLDSFLKIFSECTNK